MLSHNITVRFNYIESERKFSDDIGDCLEELVDEYQLVTSYNAMTTEQGLQYNHQIFKQIAITYCVNCVKSWLSSLRVATEISGNETQLYYAKTVSSAISNTISAIC